MIPRRRGDDGPRGGAAFRCRGTTGVAGNRPIVSPLSLVLSHGPSRVPHPVLPPRRLPTSPRAPLTLPASPTCTPQCALRRDASRWRRGIASASHKVCSCREYELPLPNQYHSSKKKKGGKKERKGGKKNQLGTYNCRTSAITVSALCPRSCPPISRRESTAVVFCLKPSPSLPRVSAARLFHHFLHLARRVPTPSLAWG